MPPSFRHQHLAAHLTPFHWREAALAVPAIPLLILIGQATGYAAEGATAAGAAFAVGFGAARELRGRRWAAMLAAVAGMSLAAFTGTLLGQDSALFILVAALAASGVAALALFDEDVWWVALQVVIAFFVAGYYRGGVEAGGSRALMVFAGGLLQFGIVVGLARLFPRAAAPLFALVPRPRRSAMLLAGHMLRAALCVAASLCIIQPLGLANGYWAPMTALIVLKPRLRDTRVRGMARLGGTLGGCLAATLFAAGVGHRPEALVVGVALAAGGAYALQKAHYAGLTACITATIVLLVSLGQADTIGNVEHRVLATLIGGTLALVTAILVPHSLPHRLRTRDRVG